jgi:hypothetical protein
MYLSHLYFFSVKLLELMSSVNRRLEYPKLWGGQVGESNQYWVRSRKRSFLVIGVLSRGSGGGRALRVMGNKVTRVWCFPKLGVFQCGDQEF